MIFSFAACGSEKNISQGSGEESTETSAQESSGKDDFSHEEDISDAQQTLGSEDGEKDQPANNILIVYFSRWGNTDYPDDVDATTSASIVPDGDGRYGTTEYIANMIADEVGGDLHLNETVTPYKADFDELRDVNHGEMERNYLPELKESNLDIAGYGAGHNYQTIADASHAAASLDGIAIEAKDVPGAQETVSMVFCMIRHWQKK